MLDNCTQCEANELEKIQHEAARIVSGATKLVSIEKNIKRSWMGYSLLPNKKTITNTILQNDKWTMS